MTIDELQLRLDAALLALRWVEFAPVAATTSDLQQHAGQWVRSIETSDSLTLRTRIDESQFIFNLTERKRRSQTPIASPRSNYN